MQYVRVHITLMKTSCVRSQNKQMVFIFDRGIFSIHDIISVFYAPGSKKKQGPSYVHCMGGSILHKDASVLYGLYCMLIVKCALSFVAQKALNWKEMNLKSSLGVLWRSGQLHIRQLDHTRHAINQITYT